MAEVGDVRGLRGLEEEGLLRLGLLTVGTGSLPFALVGTVVLQRKVMIVGDDHANYSCKNTFLLLCHL